MRFKTLTSPTPEILAPNQSPTLVSNPHPKKLTEHGVPKEAHRHSPYRSFELPSAAEATSTPLNHSTYGVSQSLEDSASDHEHLVETKLDIGERVDYQQILTTESIQAPSPLKPDCPDVLYISYPFLCLTDLTKLSAKDINMLEGQGCLRVPTRSILDEFLQQYFRHIHPFLPMLHEGHFWSLYNTGEIGKEPDGKGISLLLLQAMLFASCTVSRWHHKSYECTIANPS